MTSSPNGPHYEFMGPPGALGTMISLPLLILALPIVCNQSACPALSWEALVKSVPSPAAFFNPAAFGVTLAWFLIQVGIYVYLPGPIFEGTVIKATGEKLKYKCNGFLSMCIMLSLVALIHFQFQSLSWVHDNLLALATAAIVWSALLSIYLYVFSFIGKRVLAEGGNTGNAIYDFFIGRELNPRIGAFDWKFFCELRPGLVGWVVVNLACLAKQSELGGVSPSMILVFIFQFYYVFDGTWNESCILTTMDITTDGFGFMLVFGDLAWVPFVYSLQSRYLVYFSPDISPAGLAFIFLLHSVGLWIFRGANSQKDTFRSTPQDPSVKDLTFMTTEVGTRLITSGWWGMSRHINYFGDWLMGVAWCLPCGFSSPIPYFYAAYFAVLLIHRQIRDDHKCYTKYKKDWETYCAKVPYRIVPYVY